MVIQTAKRGFSLTEVLVATIVMSMIMTGVLGFVQYGGDIWRKGQEKINAQNYNDMTFQLLKDDMLQATKIINLSIDSEKSLAPANNLKYQIGTMEYEIKIATGSSLIKTESNLAGAAKTTTRPVRIARNVKNFYVYRISTWTLEIGLQIQSETTEDEEGNIIDPEIVSSESVILLAPGVE